MKTLLGSYDSFVQQNFVKLMRPYNSSKLIDTRKRQEIMTNADRETKSMHVHSSVNFSQQRTSVATDT